MHNVAILEAGVLRENVKKKKEEKKERGTRGRTRNVLRKREAKKKEKEIGDSPFSAVFPKPGPKGLPSPTPPPAPCIRPRKLPCRSSFRGYLTFLETQMISVSLVYRHSGYAPKNDDLDRNRTPAILIFPTLAPRQPETAIAMHPSTEKEGEARFRVARSKGKEKGDWLTDRQTIRNEKTERREMPRERRKKKTCTFL